MNIVFIGLFYGIYSEGFDRLWVKHLLDTFTLPVIFGNNQLAFFAVLRMAGTVFTILAVRFVEKRVGFDQPACNWARRAAGDGHHFHRPAWVRPFPTASSQPEPISRDQHFTQRSITSADCLDQPETGSPGTRHSPFHVRTGGCHRSGAGWTHCRCDRLPGVGGGITRDLRLASLSHAVPLPDRANSPVRE